MQYTGIFLALGALLSWGIGDFLIQRSARKFGDWIALFYITASSTLVLFFFVYKDLFELFKPERSGDLLFLLISSVVILFAAIFDFEALRVGKISVIEPIMSLEVIITASLSLFILQETLSNPQLILIAILLISIFLVATKHFHHLKSIHIEKGVWQAIIATAGMGFFNVLVGVGAREISPLMINWFTDAFITIVALGYLCFKKQTSLIFSDWKNHKKLILAMSFFDNAAWLFYSFSVLYIPIAIATSISESYIALAAGLGLFFNKEKLKTHQLIGMGCVVISIVILSLITE